MPGTAPLLRSALMREGAMLLAVWLVIATAVSGLATGAGHRHGGPTAPHALIALSAAPCLMADGSPPAGPANDAAERCAACLAASLAGLPAAPDAADRPLDDVALTLALASDGAQEVTRRLRPPTRGPPIPL